MKREFAILGAGRLGRTLGRLLAFQDYRPTGLSCRTLQSARQASAFIGGGSPTTSNPRAAARAPLVLIATPDREIVPVARELSRARLAWTGRIVAHTSGAVSSTALEPLKTRGALVASLHPLASIATSRPDAEFRGTPFAIEGAPRAVHVLRRLVLDIGGLPVTIPREAKALYHLIARTTWWRSWRADSRRPGDWVWAPVRPPGSTCRSFAERWKTWQVSALSRL